MGLLSQCPPGYRDEHRSSREMLSGDLRLDVELRIQQQLAMIEQRLSSFDRFATFPPQSACQHKSPSEMSAGQRTKQFSCNFCERSFEHSGKLHRHLRIHTGERPHECQVCGKTFIQSGQLVIHMRSHTGERPYVCTVCHKGFSCSKQLKVHNRTHTKEKPYCCDICGKSFGYNHVLKLHQVAHFAEKIYKCTLCDTTFNSKKHLESHIKYHDQRVSPPAGPTTPAPQEAPPAAHHSSVISSYTVPTTQYLLPSIHSVCPDQPEDLSKRISPVRQNNLPPVTLEMIKTLLAEDIATYGSLSPPVQPQLDPAIYGTCAVRTPGGSIGTLTPPPSVSPITSMSSMSEETLPLRKRRHLLSESSDVEESLGSPSLSSRYSVICFANNS